MIDLRSVKDEDLYNMCAAGDSDAWQYLYNYILRICLWSSIGDPENMAGEVTVKLLKGALKKVKQKDRFRNFVKVMTKNRIIEDYRSSSRKEMPLSSFMKDDGEGEDCPEIGHTDADQEEKVFGLEVVAIIDKAIEKLPVACRRIVREYLRYKAGFYEDYEELSEVLNMPVPTISSSVSRCIRILVRYPEIKALREFV